MFATQKIIRGDMSLPLGARRTGKSDRFGNEIFEEDQPILAMRQKLDAGGDPMFRINRNTGERISKVMEQQEVGKKVVTFVLDDLGNGIVTKNYAWEPQPDEELRALARERMDPLEMEKRLARMEAALSATLEATGLTAADALQMAEAKKRREPGEQFAASQGSDEQPQRIRRRDETPEQRAARLQERQNRRAGRGQ